MKRRSGICICALFVLLLFVAPSFAAFPDGKPIRIVNPFAAGGAGDVEVRMLAPLMEKHFGVPVVVENMTGAGGRIAYDKMYKETADGHTLFFITTSLPCSWENSCTTGDTRGMSSHTLSTW